MSKIRIVVADDHILVRDGIMMLIQIQPDMEVVGLASNGEEAWRLACDIKPDILIMDISMPGLSGSQATERLHYSCPQVKILVLSAHGDDAHIRQLLCLGAKGYVLKTSASQELANAIRSVHEGNVYIDSNINISPKELEFIISNKTNSELSERDLDIIKLVVRGYTNMEIAQRMYLSVKTIESYKTRINNKLGLKSRAEWVEYALKRGWLQEVQ
jgi:two-component system response regulator NreC